MKVTYLFLSAFLGFFLTSSAYSFEKETFVTVKPYQEAKAEQATREISSDSAALTQQEQSPEKTIHTKVFENKH